MKRFLMAGGGRTVRWAYTSSRAVAPAATLAALLLTMSFLAQAQPSVPIPAEYGELLKSRTTPAALGPDLFGDEVNLYDGSLRFRQTDVALPGNDALSVAVTRTFQVKQPEGVEGFFADWDLEIPHLHGVFSNSGWVVPGGTPNHRCSAFGAPPGATGVAGLPYLAEEFWSGTFLSLPGGGGEVLKATAGTPKPTDGQTYPLTTRDGTVFRCLPAPLNNPGAGEGFEAVTPDGVRYQFDHMVHRMVRPLFKANPAAQPDPDAVAQRRLAVAAFLAQGPALTVVPTPDVLPDGDVLPRREVWLLPTVITDRFGNTVTFTWDASDKWKLLSVTGSDGRSLTFTHDGSSHRIKTVTDGPHTWTYTYTAAGSGFRLSGVTLPDTTSKWVFNLEPLRNVMASISGAGCEAAGVADVNPTGTGTLTHPGGATGSFTVAATEHGRSHVPLTCNEYNYANGVLGYAVHPARYLVPSLTTKTLSGPGVTAQSWIYAYGAANGCYTASAFYPEIGGRCTANSPTTTTVDVTDPEQDVTRYTFRNQFRSTEGQLWKIEAGFSDATALRTTTNTYAAEAAGPWPNPVGTPVHPRNDGYMSARHRPLKTRLIEQQNADFIWDVPPACASNGTSGTSGSTLCFDRFARPTQATETGSATRTTKTEYYDHTGKWVLGQVKKSTLGSTVVADIGFDATYGLPLTFTRFGQLQHTAAYDTASAVATGQRGTLTTLTDGNNQTTTYSDWKRGIPQAIDYPDGSGESVAVSNTGWIDSVTDELGYKTCYEPDLMGRLKTITYPSETAVVTDTCDASAWNVTSIGYAKVAAPGYGLPANLWRRTETTGTRKTETFYDGAWQPILERRSTTDASAGQRFVRRDFFPIGRNIFESFPVDTVPVSGYADIDAGTHHHVDVLGRPVSTAVDSELPAGLLIHETTYPPDAFKTVHTPARGAATATTTTYQTFAEPSYDAPLVITAPEGTKSTYTRDLWGKPLTLTRSGPYTPPGGALENLSALRRFVYDPQQRLCKTIEPDAGITVFDYDAAGNLAWRAAGQATLTSTSDCQRASVAAAEKSVHAYDARNRLTWIDHPSGTSDVGYSYDADGAMLTASVSATGNTTAPPFGSSLNTWTYTYKRRRLLATETLAVGARTFALIWAYNTRGDVSTLTYPGGGGSVSFNPNAYGEPRQVGTYATNAAYHPYGGLASFTYGTSGLPATTRTITPNTRQLPGRILDVRGGTTWLDHSLTYDENGNLKQLTDGVVDPEGQPPKRAR